MDDGSEGTGIPLYQEVCSCGAVFEVNATLLMTIPTAFWEQVAIFRSTHRHLAEGRRRLGFDTTKTGGSSISATAGDAGNVEDIDGMWAAIGDTVHSEDDDYDD